MESLSIWDQKNRKFIRNGYRPGRVTLEFPRTKKLKIVEHTLAEINFGSKAELNDERNQTIARDILKKVGDSFNYENVGGVYTPDGNFLEEIAPNEFNVLAHGQLNEGTENCSIEGLKCSDGTDTECKPGKCIIGRILKNSSFRWKYISANTYDNGIPVEYFVGGIDFVELRTIVRGTHRNLNGTVLNVDKPASKASTIFLPPKNYLEDAFSSTFIKFFNLTLDLDGSDTLSGIATTEEEFISRVIKLAYRNVGDLELGPTYASLANLPLSEQVYKAIDDIVFRLDKVWKDKITEITSPRWENRLTSYETNREFISYVFRELSVLFFKCIQVVRSGFKQSRILSTSDENTRPIYFRLPSASLGYRTDEDQDILVVLKDEERFNLPISSLDIGTIVVLSDRSAAYQFLPRAISNDEERKNLGLSPIISDRTKEELYSPKDVRSWIRLPEDRIPRAPVAKWILSGADEFLREKKSDIESFYYTYLDPTECSPKNLDWLAQHVGLAGEFWNVEWRPEYKRTLIRNALGWFEKDLSITIGTKEYKTIKGEVLDEAPFNSLPWRDTEEIVNQDEVDISDIDLSKISNRNFSIYKENWNGLIESKGNILSLVFLFSLFNVKNNVNEELVFVNDQYRVKSGLRAQEVNAPVLLPIKRQFAQVGTESDFEIKAYSNQLVADQTVIADKENVNDLFFRLPFYYNRDGITWDLVTNIAKYWSSAKLTPRVQYAYLAADTWRVGDGFFELIA